MIPCFSKVTRGHLVSVQEPDSVHGEGDGSEILFYLSLQDIGPHLVQQVAGLMVRSWEENRLRDTSGGLKDTEGILAELSQVLPA